MLKAFFVSGILLGFVGVLVGAGFYPWVDHPRLVSRTLVQANGGRREDFFVRLPVDRVASVGTEELSLGAGAFPPELELPATLSGQPLQIDHFKVRDAGGNVVGVASRHTIVVGDAAEIAWSIALPSRGALWLVGSTDRAALAAAFTGIGYQPGESWNGDLEILVGPDGVPSGRVEGGSSEFAALRGSYTERWRITGIGDTGELRGTIELNTTTNLER